MLCVYSDNIGWPFFLLLSLASVSSSFAIFLCSPAAYVMFAVVRAHKRYFIINLKLCSHFFFVFFPAFLEVEIGGGLQFFDSRTTRFYNHINLLLVNLRFFKVASLCSNKIHVEDYLLIIFGSISMQ